MTDLNIDKNKRLTQLDGLRGLAILLVFFTHARLGPLFEINSPIIKTFLSVLTSNGGIGVSILFLLSGYLMMSLYPIVPSAMAFWQKRYTRIFPAFLTMTVALAVVRFLWKDIPWWLILMIAFSVIRLGGYIWEKVRKSSKRLEIGQALFKFFIFAQLAIAIGYVVFQKLIPPAVFMQLWPEWTRVFITWLVNATMSLPFGNYIGQLDGVYWSVCTEVLFYLLYPRLFLPLFNLIVSKKSWLLNILALISAALFFYGLNLISVNILGLHLLQLHLAIFFVLGMSVSRFEHSAVGQKLAEKINQTPGLIWSLFSLSAVLTAPLLWKLIVLPAGVDTILWSIPLTIMLFLTLTVRNAWASCLQSKWLILLGTVSYAIYLTHTLALEIFVKNGPPQTISQTLLTLIISIIVVGLLATIVHIYLERPYLFDKIKATPKLKMQPPKSIEKITIFILIIGYLSLVWISYRVPVSILARIENHIVSELPLISPITNQDSLILPFTVTQNNLGMLMVNIKPLSKAESAKLGLDQVGGETLANLRAILRSGDQIINQIDFPMYQIYSARFFTIGLPIQSDSENKTYQLELSITSPLADKNLALVNEKSALRSVYFQSKQYYLKNPSILIKLILEKAIQPFTEQTALKTLFYALPLSLILVGVYIFRKK
jgi:peptidoglycan/LPS O-acetylase OafA/YrhL